MGFNKSGDNTHISLYIVSIHPNIAAVTRAPEMSKCCVIKGTVVDNPYCLNNVCAKHLYQFLPSIGTVRTSAIDNDKVLAGHMGKLCKYPGHEPFTWRGTR